MSEYEQYKDKQKTVSIFDSFGRFSGEWGPNGLHGYGIALYVTGERYEGQWKEGKRDGWGIMWWPQWILPSPPSSCSSGEAEKGWERYEGEWKGGKRSGEGIKYGRNGKVCHAIWENDHIKTVLSKTGGKK